MHPDERMRSTLPPLPVLLKRTTQHRTHTTMRSTRPRLRALPQRTQHCAHTSRRPSQTTSDARPDSFEPFPTL